MPRKPFSQTNSQISSGTSRSSFRMRQSSSFLQSSSVGPSRKACSSSVSVIGAIRRSFEKSGATAEKLRVPASGARFDRLTLGVRDRRHCALQSAKYGLGDVAALNGLQAASVEEPGQQPACEGPKRKPESNLEREGIDRARNGPSPERCPVHCKRKKKAPAPIEQRSVQPHVASTVTMPPLQRLASSTGS